MESNIKNEASNLCYDENISNDAVNLNTSNSCNITDTTVNEKLDYKSRDIQADVAIKFKIPSSTLFNNNLASNIEQLQTEKKQPELPQVEDDCVSKKNKEKYKSLSPAEKIKEAESAIPYKEPSWGAMPNDSYYFEVLKNGAIVDRVELSNKSYQVFGRLPSCDVQMDHPSLSRYHAVVQFCKQLSGVNGWYLYDLDSTHGTWLNKNKIPSNVFRRIRVGHQIKFGGSTRVHILQGPENDQDAESELSITAMNEQRHKQTQLAKVLRQAEREAVEHITSVKPLTECTWGIAEDAEEEADDTTATTGDAAVLANTVDCEELYLDDPKKALKGFYEREGFDLPQYEFADASYGKKKCMVELPIDDGKGQSITAEVTGTGKKKEMTVACALEACRILDRHGVLRASTHESHKRKKRNWEDDDYYESDEDTFLDRTGTIERKRVSRMKKEGKEVEKGDTHEDIVVKHNEVVAEIQVLENRLEQAKQDATAMEDCGEDALDAYMNTIKSGVMDTSTKMKLRVQLLSLRKNEARLRNLVNISKPAHLPAVTTPKMMNKITLPSKASQLYGKVRKLQAVKSVKKAAPTKMSIKENEDSEDSEEFDEEDDNEDMDIEEKNDAEIKNAEQVTMSLLKHTTAPHTMAPHTTAPHTTAPHTTAPHTTATHTTEPHTTAPHTMAPHTTATHTTAPHTTATHTTEPHTTAPHTMAPHTTATHTTEPHTTAPHTTATHTTEPHTTAMPITGTGKTECGSDDTLDSRLSKSGSETIQIRSIDDKSISKQSPMKTEIESHDTECIIPDRSSNENEIGTSLKSSSGNVHSSRRGKDSSSKHTPVSLKSRDRNNSLSTTPPTNYTTTVTPHPDFVEWLPPLGQSGDGKTRLNEKYGY